MILKRQKIGSFQLVHELNGDGVELDMGGLGKREMFDNKLREPHFQQLFRETAQKYQLEVSSIAMSGFYGQSFLERANYKELVQDCLHAMRVMNTKVAFLPLGVELFDVYEGKNLEAGKKSYAVSFLLQDENQTLNDKMIDKIMSKLVKNLEDKLGAKLR